MLIQFRRTGVTLLLALVCAASAATQNGAFQDALKAGRRRGLC